MRDAGVIADYALFGAAAQMRYTEAVATLDADVLVAVPSPDRLDVLSPIYEYCRTRGYAPEGEAVRVGAWPALKSRVNPGEVINQNGATRAPPAGPAFRSPP
jgi:hypothetical protein